VRIMHLARVLKHKTEPGKHYGNLTGKFVDVLHAMLWLIHDGRSGQWARQSTLLNAPASCPGSTGSPVSVSANATYSGNGRS
jgi:hypothetical protein